MQSQSTCRNNDHVMHAHYTARQILHGSCRMFSASAPTLYYHIQWPEPLRRQFYTYCNHCSTNQPAEKMTILYMLTILLSKYCRGHAECSRPRTQYYTTTLSGRKHSGVTFMHTIVNAITVYLPKDRLFYTWSVYCLADTAGVTPHVLGLGTDTILPY